jgi:hypothetical protein
VPPHPPARAFAPAGELTVRPDSLPLVGSRLLATAAELRALGGDVRVVAELAVRGLGSPVVASAATGFVRAWDDAVDGEADVLDHLAGSLAGAAWAYGEVEARLAGGPT